MRQDVRGEVARADIALARNATDRLLAGSGTQLHCTSGCLWITHDGDPKDIILGAGEHCSLRPARRVLVQALEPSAYRLG